MKEENKIFWPGWETVRCIGRGGFGAVYEIKRNVAGKTETAALKVLTIPEQDEQIDELYSDGYGQKSISEHFKGHMEDIQREYSIMLDLKGHGNIVYCDDLQTRLHDDGIGWDIYIKMELLTPLLKTIGSDYDEEQVIKLGKDICSALIFCQQQNIIHRDIKPQNIFVSRTGAYKLGDFGIAKVTDKTSSGTKIGTCDYMAPEIYRAQNYHFQVDVYSLGLVMYWMMNQKTLPFLEISQGIPTAQERETARARRFDGEALPAPVNGSKALQTVVLKACAFDPAERFSNAGEFLDALEHLKEIPVMPEDPVDLDVRKTMVFPSNDHPAGRKIAVDLGEIAVKVIIPETVTNGETLVFPGKGLRDDCTGKCGDLYLTVVIENVQKGIDWKKLIPIAAGAIAILAILLMFFLPGNGGKQKLPDETKPTLPAQIPTESTDVPTEVPTQIATETQDPCASGHAWVDATVDAPKFCQNCGLSEGRSLGTLLSKSRFVEDSNAQGSKTDVNVGTWTDCFGGTHYDSLRFWVCKSGSWANIEHIVYNVGQQYNELDVLLQLEENSQAAASAYIRVYADGNMLFTSQTVDRDSSAVSFTVDISGISEIRIECVTDAPYFAYCIVEAVTYKT